MICSKWFFIINCVALSISCTQKAVPAGSNYTSSGISILSYNIHHANPPSKPNVIDIEAIAHVINLQQPDIVALQEIDVHTNRSGKTVNEAEEIARLTGMKYYFAKAIDYDDGEYGVAILSKLPMEAMTNNPLPTAEGTRGEHRTLATAIINLPGNKKIVFASTHLDAQRSDTNRLLQIKKIGEFFNNEKLPVIIAGDFNATPNSDVINILDKYFTRTCLNNCGSTIPVIIPTKTIDFIAYKPSDKFIVIEQKVVDEQYASDHRPVLALFKLK
jgi:endonuclease/exonuclease/phosphatase family metal-dependent hydrolase